MLQLRYILRLTFAFIARFKVILAAGAIVGIVAFFFLRLLLPLILGGQTQRIGIAGRFKIDTLPTAILKEAGEGLTSLDESGIAQPALAALWETPDKGKTWVFHLRDDKFWQDGKKVEAGEVVYEFSDAQIERSDAKTLIFKLENPFSPFPQVVSQPVFRKGLLGTGEWRVTKVSIAGSYVTDMTLQKKDKTKKIYKFYPTEERLKLAYKLGEVDTVLNIFNKEPFSGWKTVDIKVEVDENRYVIIFFNVQDKLTGEKSVRQALTYAIDKSKFTGPRAISPISPNSWAYNPQVKPYHYDKERAKELIEDLPKELKDSLEVKLVTTPLLLNTAEQIAKYWEDIGVKTTLQVSSSVPTDYQAFLAIFDAPADPDQYAIWHSTQDTTNISRYKNDRIDKLLEDGRTELNLTERRKIYLDFQRFLVEDSPAAFLYHPTTYTISRK